MVLCAYFHYFSGYEPAINVIGLIALWELHEVYVVVVADDPNVGRDLGHFLWEYLVLLVLERGSGFECWAHVGVDEKKVCSCDAD